MKKTRRFVALLLAAVLALALFTACGAAGAEEPQSAIGKVYEDWFVEQLKSERPEGKTVQKVNRPDMREALAEIGENGKFKARDGWGEYLGAGEHWYWLILSDPQAWADKVVPQDSIVDAVALTPENMTKYGPVYFIKKEYLSRIKEYDIATRVMDGKTYVAVYLRLEK